MRALSLCLLWQENQSFNSEGKTINMSYYRCIGTDAYRFGGERIRDNKQVRTERFDDVVWGQVLDAIKNPKRLKKEYENRLNRMEGDTRDLFDTTALRKKNRKWNWKRVNLV